jgi:hypothetical protein
MVKPWFSMASRWRPLMKTIEERDCWTGE